MEKIATSIKLNAPADTVWGIIGDPAGLADWHPAIATSEAHTHEGSPARVCTLGDGAKLLEKIDAHDDAAKQYTYSIVESPLPLKSYRSTIGVRDAGGGCEVHWSAEFEPEGDAEQIKSMLKDVYDAGLNELKNRVGG